MNTPILLPVPKELGAVRAQIALPKDGVILFADKSLFFEASYLQQSLSGYAVRLAPAAKSFAVKLVLDANASAQSYTLNISENGVEITGDHAGVFYGVCTLKQLLAQYDRQLPVITIKDAPDFPVRGVMLDISRDKVPSYDTILMMIDEFASIKINQIQLYTEHTFSFANHPLVWQHASPITHEEILLLDAYCKQRHIDLVPNQNSLGHVERWLKHPEYLHLAEKPEGFVPPWGGEWRSPSTLNPLDPASMDLINELYDELLPHFSSPLFNVGCDEPWELGQGKSKEAIEARGGRVYLDWLLQLYQSVTKRKRQMMFWGDIIVHYPDLVPELPRDSIVLEWGYESTHPFDEHGALFAQSGIPYYVCPGTSSWNGLVGRAQNAMDNNRIAAETGLKHGAVGFLNTDWGDNGHWQPWPASYVGFAYGAGVSWGLAANADVDLAKALDLFIYRDPSGTMGQTTMRLANVYTLVGPEHINGQILAYTLQWSQDQIAEQVKRHEGWGGEPADLSPENLRRVIAKVDAYIAELDNHKMARPDATLIISEWTQAARLIQHGAKWILLATGHQDNSPKQLLDELDSLIMQQRENWLARNRRGGLEDSIRRFDKLRGEYLRLMA